MNSIESYTLDGVTQFVRNSIYNDDRISMAEARTYDIGTQRIETFIDVGAHIGSFTCWLKSKWPDAEGIAYEPELGNFEVLQRNTAQWDDVFASHNPVGYCDDRPVVGLHPDHTTCHLVALSDKVPPGMLVQQTNDYVTLEQTLDAENWDVLSLLKIDCEGCELDVLVNCSDKFLLRTMRICGEFHNGPDFFMRGIGARLQSLGFTVTAELNPKAHSVFSAWRL